jgi:tetratricopeptide (TPR) repeat protein
MADYRFTISLGTFDSSLLPPGSPAKGSKDYPAAVHDFLRNQFAGFQGNARIVVSEDSLLLEWTPPSPEHDPIEAAVSRLEKGELIPAVLMLELLRQQIPNEFRLLYNLGVAYSRLGQLEETRATLREALRLDPNHVNSRVALGVTFATEGRYHESVEILEEAVAADPDNPWAQRNLGGCLLALNEVDRATACLLRATQLNPKDEQAFFGLGKAYGEAGNLVEADAAYRQVIAIDEFSRSAQLAKEQLSSLAHIGFLMRGGGTGRSDAVMYCLSAMEHFAKLPDDEVQRIVFEIGMLGTKGFEVNDTTQQYQLQSMPGKFSGMQMVCIMYVGFKRIAPEYAASFDLSNEYAVAKELFEKRRRKP